MKARQLIYWVSTILLSLMMSFTVYMYLTKPGMVKEFQHLGFPDWFRIEISVGKIIGIAFLLAPIQRRFKEWAYAGFAIVFLSALIAHSAAGDQLKVLLGPVVALGMLVISYLTFTYTSKAGLPV